MKIINRKLDNSVDEIRKLSFKTDDLCSSEFRFAASGTYTTLLGILFTTGFALKFTWISESTLRIISYIVLFAITVAVMTLWRWNRQLTSTMKDWKDATKRLSDLACDLNDKHHALSSQYQKKSDNLEQLNQHHNVLLAVLSFTGLDVGLGIAEYYSKEGGKK